MYLCGFVCSDVCCRYKVEGCRLRLKVQELIKKDGLSVRMSWNIGKPQVAFLFAVLLFMSIFCLG